jgi:hypothetical protein
MDSSETSFIPIPEQAEELVCMAVSPDKSHLALSHINKNDSFPVISIYNI